MIEVTEDRQRLPEQSPQAVRLAVVDVDGCLTPGVARDWNWAALHSIHGFNQRARRGEPVPAVTLCTGRQQPYVEVLMQAIGAFLPGIYENGCGLYFPEPYRFVEHPNLQGSTRESLASARAIIDRKVVASGLATFQPGRDLSLSLFPSPGMQVDRLRGIVEDFLAKSAVPSMTVEASAACVDITPEGVDKGTALRWLAGELGIPLARIGGIGDARSDLRFLRLVGHPAAPANAATEVRATVSYVSPFPNGDGVVDILQRWADISR